MSNQLKPFIRSLTPPFIWQIASNLKLTGPSNGRKRASPLGEEKPAEYYNQLGTGGHLKTHYTKSHYYPTWLLIADHMERAGTKKILDIGCGPGQFGRLLVDNGFRDYTGIDFSELRIEYARKVCPEFDFRCKDIFEEGLMESIEYDTVVMTEFLEHITEDLVVIRRIRHGARIYGTVPNYGGEAHVRKYETPDYVRNRYEEFIDEMSVRAVPQTKEGNCLQLFEGVRNSV